MGQLPRQPSSARASLFRRFVAARSIGLGLLMLFAGSVQAATFNLPGGPLPSGCSADGNVVTCTSDVNLGEEDQVNVNGPVDWIIQGNLDTGEEGVINSGGSPDDLNIDVTGNVNLGEESSVNANVTADGNVNTGEEGTIDGNIIAGGTVDVGEDGTVNGCVSADSVTNRQDINCDRDIALLANRTTVEVGESLTLAVAAQNCSSVNADRWRNTWRDNDGLGVPSSGQQPKTTTSPCDQAPSRTFTVSASAGIYNVEFESEWCRDGSAGPNTFECPANQAGATQFATFGIDSVDIEVVASGTPAAQLELRMEEFGWDGTAGEVTDASGNGNDGTSQNGADTAIETPDPAIPGDPGTCRYGSFDGSDDFLRIPHDDSLEMSDTDAVTVTAWVRKSSRQNTNWIAIAQKSDTSYNLQLAGGNEPTFTIHDGTWHEAGAGLTLNTGQWYHLAGTYDGNEVRIYVDGQLEGTATASGTITDASSFDVGVGENLDASGRHFDGQIDELRIYDQGLSASEVSDVAQATHPCAGLVTEYRMDEASWNGSAGEVVDETGNGHGGTASGGATTEGSDPARPGAEGTCRYGTFDGNNDGVSDADAGNYLSGADAVTVTAWVYNTDGLGGNNRGIFFTDSPVGKDNRLGMRYDTRGANGGDNNVIKAGVQTTACNDGNDCVQVETQANVMTANTWQHVAMTWESGGDLRVYVDGNDVTGDGTGDSGQGTGGSLDAVDGLRIAQGAKGERWQGRIDEFRVYDAALSQSRVQEVFQSTHPCADQFDHYAIEHDGSAVSCATDAITVTAHDTGDNAVDAGSATLDLTAVNQATADSEGTWSRVLAGSGTLADGTAGDGVAQYQFPDNGETSVTLGFNYTDVAEGSPETVNFDVSDGGGTTEAGNEDPDLVVRHSGFRITDGNGNSINVPDQIAAKPSDMAPNAQTLGLQAIRTSDSDPSVCEPAFPDGETVEVGLGAECKDPDQCAGRELHVTNGGTTTEVDTSDDDGTTGAASYEPVELDFGTNAEAPLTLRYPDAGRIQFHARFDPIDDSGDEPTVQPITGSSNDFVVRPFGFFVDFDPASDGTFDDRRANASCADQVSCAADSSGDVFTTAAMGFDVQLNAVVWQATDDSDDNGVPDSNQAISDNEVTPNLGQEATPENATVTRTLVAPPPPAGASGSLSGGTGIGGFNNGQTTATLAWDEVGIIDLTASLTDGNYLGSGEDVTGVAPDVGRFKPDDFEQTVADPGMFENVHTEFTYLGQRFSYEVGMEPKLSIEARNAAGETTINYSGGFAKLVVDISAAGADGRIERDPPTADNDQTGVDTAELPVSGSLAPGTFADPTALDGKVTYEFAEAVANDSNDADQPDSSVDSYRYDRDIDRNNDDRNDARVGPFNTDLTIGIERITDADGAETTNDDRLTDVTPDPAEIRFGRLLIDDGAGPETADVGVPVRAEYWAGETWFVNEADNLTALTLDTSATEVHLSNGSETVDGDQSIPVDGGSTEIANASPVSLVDGEAVITLTNPGEGNRGWVDVTALLATDPDTGDTKEHPYLQTDPDDNGVWDADPTGRATFGIFAGEKANIYRREVFPAP